LSASRLIVSLTLPLEQRLMNRLFSLGAAETRSCRAPARATLRVAAVALLAGLSLLGAQVALASTTATQNVTFSVAQAVAITASTGPSSLGAIDPSSGGGTASGTGTLTLASNDTSGFQLQVNTSGSSVTEAGCGSPIKTANTNIVSVAGTSVSGGSGSQTGTPNSSTALNGTTQVPLYGTGSGVPNRIGSGMSVTLTYTVNPGYTTPANTSGCTYTVPVTTTIVAQ
jgi:hypothetical protein